MKKIKLALVRLPILSITLFFFSCFAAAYLHPGSEKEGIGYKSNHYSFTHNFLSELGELKTNTNQSNPAIIRKNNTPSMILFNGGLILIGATIMLFYIQFKEVFKVLNDSKKTQFYARLSKPLGLLAGVFYAGVGFVPHDLDFGLHVFFANGAFLILFILCILHSITIFHSNLLSNQYLLGYLSFCILLFIYLWILFFGPEIGPGKSFTEADWMLQVVAQKAIVLTFMISILHQVYGFHKLLREKNF
ncbi:MAG: hypothetical protein ACPH94_01195 [Flavobacteriaceae bacterium]